MTEFADYAWLVGDEAAVLLDRIAADPRPALAQLQSLRKEISAEQARLVVEQVGLRQRGAKKFGSLAGRMFFTPVLLEQATDLAVARYKAAKFRPLADGARVYDGCCGIGGDLLALAEHGPTLGCDLSPATCLLAEANLRAATDRKDWEVCVGDVSATTPAAGERWHLDPDRRASGRRSVWLEHHSPGPESIARWRAASPSGAVKLSPATEPPIEWLADSELEWITHRRECRQLVTWFGDLAMAPGRRRATIVESGEEFENSPRATSFVGVANLPLEPAGDVGAYLFDPDPSVLAAGLLGAVAAAHELRTLGFGGAYLTADNAPDELLLDGFAVLDVLPLRPGEVAQYLAARGVGRVEIKTRGLTLDPESFRRKLKLRGDAAATLILTRIDKRQVAIVAERVMARRG